MCHLADVHAIHLIEQAISLQHNSTLLNHLNAVLLEMMGDKDSEYDLVELESINDLVEDISSETIPPWEGKKEAQATTLSSHTGREIPKRDPQRAAKALAHAGFLCEYDKNDRTFLRKNGKPYTEPHHLIPLSKYKDFEFSVDVMENIVSLCSHCHNLLHYGRFEDKKVILLKLYSERIEALKICGLNLTLDQLFSYYR